MLGLLRTGLNPFDPKTVFLAKHAQHVVLVHFPIALFVTAVLFDAMAQRTKQRAFADAAYYNLFWQPLQLFLSLSRGYSRGSSSWKGKK